MPTYKVMHGPYQKFLDPLMPLVRRANTIFADPPDNIDLSYDEYEDRLCIEDYAKFLENLVKNSICFADTVYISFNARWMTEMGVLLANGILPDDYDIRWMIQGFTFGQHNKHDLANNFRPIVRIRHPDAPLFPDATRVESDRMKQGDKRANPAGRVPGDVWFSDFLEYSRVVGNSKQRRRWHPTQLNEGVVEDCLLMSTPPDGYVIDPFCGTGTTLRVCMANSWTCATMDVSENYCQRVAEENGLQFLGNGIWALNV